MSVEELTLVQQRLNYLRREIRAERISMNEIIELEGLSEHIDPDDTELMQWIESPQEDEDYEDEE